MIKKVMMATTIIVMMVIVLVTPRYIGTSTEVGALPQLLVDHTDNHTKIYVSAIGDYRYPNITLKLTLEGQIGTNLTVQDNQTYFLGYNIPDSTALTFHLNVTLYIKEVQYGYNCTVVIEQVPDSTWKESIRVIEKSGNEVKMDWDQPYRRFLEVLR